jgi:hypothetical protein
MKIFLFFGKKKMRIFHILKRMFSRKQKAFVLPTFFLKKKKQRNGKLAFPNRYRFFEAVKKLPVCDLQSMGKALQKQNFSSLLQGSKNLKTQKRRKTKHFFQKKEKSFKREKSKLFF